MKKDRYEEWFSDLDDRSIEEIAADVPALDDAARERIEALCEEKMRMRDMKMGNEEIVYAGNIQNITRTQWFRPVMTAAACLVLAAGVGGMMMLGGNHHGVTPQPPVNSGVEDTTAAVGEETETEAPTRETVAVIVTETAISGVAEVSGTTSAASAATETTTVTTASEGEDEPDLEMMRAMFDRNVKCLKYFVTSPCSPMGEPLDGQSIYAVNSPDFTSYADLERYVYATYTDTFAEELLHNFPLNGPVYLEYNGTFCIDTWYALGGLSMEANWDDYQIKHPAVIDENRMTFDVVAANYYVPEEPVALTCRMVKENGSWQFDTMYGYEKVEQDYPEKPSADSAIKEELHTLVELSMYLGVYPVKGEALPGTSLYEVDFYNLELPCDYIWDYDSFEECVRATYTPEVAEWILHDSIFENVDGVLYIDMSKAAYMQGALVNWSQYSIIIDTLTEAENGNTCTFRAVATDDPAVQFPDATLEDRTERHTAQYVDGLGWRLSEKPDYLLK